MIINDLNVKNVNINLEDIHLDFSKTGVHIITGKNGSGKTSLIRKILFKNEGKVSIVDREEEFLKDPELFIAFVPQSPNQYSTSIKGYITKSTTGIDEKYLEELMSNFKLDYLDMKRSVKVLSNGELQKISLIATFIKDTPYIILDEPTNHLDDSSVNTLLNILDQLKQEKTIIIITHDQRILSKYEPEVLVEETGIRYLIKDKTELKNLNKNKPSKVSFHPVKNYIKRQFSIYSIACITLILLVCSFFLTYNNFLFLDNWSMNNETRTKDIIHTYKAEYIYQETNKIYTDAKGLKISEDKYERMILNSDIEDILNNKDVKKVIALDDNLLHKQIYEDKIFCVPTFFLNDYQSMYVDEAVNIGKVIEGRKPRDFKEEICIPINTVKNNKSHINKSQLINMIGTSITYHNKEYKLTGFTDGEVTLISCGKDKDSPFTWLSKDNINHYINSREPSDALFIFTSPGKEETVLNTLISTYPAENYSSYQFSKVWEKSYNKKFVIKNVLPINFIISILFSIILIILRRYQGEADHKHMVDYCNYYLKFNSCRIINLGITAALSIMIGIIMTIVDFLICKMAQYDQMIILLDYIIICIPSLIYYLLKVWNKDLRNDFA